MSFDVKTIDRTAGVLPIVYYPDARLRQTASPVDAALIGQGKPIDQLVYHLLTGLVNYDGLAIAAPQLGIPFRIIAVSEQVTKGPQPVVLVNPKVEWVSGPEKPEKEACLSFPGVSVFVSRPGIARITALTPHGEALDIQANGLYARALLHEIDHLDGRLLIDYAPKIRRSSIRNKLRKYLSKVQEVAW